MLKNSVLVGELNIEPKNTIKILRDLKKKGWTPAMLDTLEYFSKKSKANLENPIKLKKLDTFQSRKSAGYINGDIFFDQSDDDIYYLVNHCSGKDMPKETVFTQGKRKIADAIEIGVISKDHLSTEDKIQAFSDAITESIKNTLDGRKTRHMNFKWIPLSPNGGKLDRLKIEQKTDLSFKMPDYSKREAEDSDLIANDFLRSILLNIGRAGLVRDHDILQKSEESQEKSETALTSLKENNLLETEYLLECRKTGNQLTRLQEKNKLQESEISDLTCPYCDSRFKDENLTEVYLQSQSCKSLLKQSHWQTIYVTGHLIDLGIPKNDIIWNLSESGEEIDIILEFMGELWIFELKDRDFGAGDAHPFNYRQVKYNANKGIIICAGQISKNAREVFKELLQKATHNSIKITYVEGLNELSEKLETTVLNTILNYSQKRIEALGESFGYDLGPILRSRFEDVSLEYN